LAMVILFSIWGFWVSGRGETRKRHPETDPQPPTDGARSAGNI
jgi:hypothetical protein